MGNEVKAWWKSVSLWITVLTVVGLVLDKLALDGLIPNEGWYAIVASIVGLVTKRGLTENTAMRVAGLLEAEKTNPS